MNCKICGAGINIGDKVFTIEHWEVKNNADVINLLRIGGGRDIICSNCYAKVFI